MAKKTHKDVEFSVGKNTFRTLAEAAQEAVATSVTNGRKVNIDVLVHSRAGAKWWAGDEGVAAYLEDPDASVFDRLEVFADSKGRVA